MKKKSLIILWLLFLPFVSSIQYACTNNTQVISNSEEITFGQIKSFYSIPTSICDPNENSVLKWVETNVFLDANIISLSAINISTGTELLSSNKSISYSLIQDDAVTLKIDSSTSVLELGECSELANNAVMIKSITPSGVVEVLVAADSLLLNTKTNPSEIVTINSKNYGIELLSGSSSRSSLKFNKCNNGDLYEIETPVTLPINNSINSTNQTSANSNSTNQTIQGNDPSLNQTIIQNNTSNQTSLKEISKSCTSNEECSTNYCKKEICSKKGFFRKFLEWFGNLFE